MTVASGTSRTSRSLLLMSVHRGIVLQKSFCTVDRKVFELYTRLSSKHVGGTSSPGDKNRLGDFGNEPDATSISNRGLFRLLAGNLSPGVFRLLQHNLPGSDSMH